MVPISHVRANDYNPNKVAPPEMELLRLSMEADGVTQPVVVFPDGAGSYIVVDGFHRFTLMKDHFKCNEIPVVEIDKPIAERMASTIRHNRARGKHQVDSMASIVAELVRLGLDNTGIAERLGMSEEELLRLMQAAGVARILAGSEYSYAWGEDGEQVK